MAVAASCQACRWAWAALASGIRITSEIPALRGGGVIGPGPREELSDPHTIANARHYGPFRRNWAGSWASRQEKPRPFRVTSEEPGQREAPLSSPTLG